MLLPLSFTNFEALNDPHFLFRILLFSEVEIEDDSDDDLQYEEVPEDEPDDDEVDFAKVLSTIKLKGATDTKGTSLSGF